MRKMFLGLITSLFTLTLNAQNLQLGAGEICATSQDTASDCYDLCRTGLFMRAESGEFICVDLTEKLEAGEICATSQDTAGDCYNSCDSGFFMRDLDGIFKCVDL